MKHKTTRADDCAKFLGKMNERTRGARAVVVSLNDTSPRDQAKFFRHVERLEAAQEYLQRFQEGFDARLAKHRDSNPGCTADNHTVRFCPTEKCRCAELYFCTCGSEDDFLMAVLGDTLCDGGQEIASYLSVVA